MENIASHMKLVELKQSNLCKAHEQLHAEAASFLLFSLQWKDLEQHFDWTKEMIQSKFEELDEREKAVASKEKQLDDVGTSIDECCKVLELKKDELSELNSLIEKCDGELRLKEGELDLAQVRLVLLTKDIKLKEDELNMVCIRILDVEKEFEHKEKAFDMVRKRIDDCEHVIELKEQQLNGIMQLIEERSMECELKGKSVESIRTLLQEHVEELATKEKQYDAIQMAIKESTRELKLKEKELESIQNMVATKWKEKRLDKIEKNIKLRTEELDLKVKEFGLMQNKVKDLSEDLLSKESELESMKTCIKEHSKELDMQEKQLDNTQQSIRDCQNVVILLTKYVRSIEKAIIECSKEWELKENHVDSLQESVDDYSNEVPSVEERHNSISLIVDKCLEGLNAQKEHFNLLRKSIEERSMKLKNEEIDFERRTEELKKKDEKVSMHLKEIQSVKIDMASQMELLEKGREELRLKERLHQVEAEKLFSKEKDISLVRSLMEKCSEKAKLVDNPNILHPNVKTEESDCKPADSSNTLSFHAGATLDGKLLLVLLCEHLKLHDFVRTELIITLQTSSDPAKLVLDAMRWFYLPHMVSEDAKLDLHNVKRGCILLSELLLKFSPQIKPPVKEEALKLAGQWKAKMSVAVENHVEVVAFLQLVANYGLASNFNADELQILLNSVSQYKQAIELARALGIAYKSSEDSATCSLVKLKRPEYLAANVEPVSSLKNEQLSMDQRRLYLLMNKQLCGLQLMPSAILSTLKESSDPAKLVLDVIQGSYHQQLKKEQIGFEDSLWRWWTLLLKQLKQISPSIDPKVKEDAMKLAVDWKLNMRRDTNDSLETVSFLQFLVSYGLTTTFSEKEILKLFENIVQREEAEELCVMFGYTKKLEDLVQNLIGTKQFVEAVRFICGYKLKFFRPTQILDEYLRDARTATLKASKKKNTGQEDVRAAMEEAIHKEVDALKSVIKCVADCNLSSEISSQGLENRIVLLEEMRRSKWSSHVQPQRSTMVELQQGPHPINVQSQQPHKANFEVQRMHPTKGEMHSPHLMKAEVQRMHPSKGEMHSPPSMKAESQQLHPTHQPLQQHPTHQPLQMHPAHQPQQQHPHQPQQQFSCNIAVRQKKRKGSQFQKNQKKFRRKSPIRPVFSSSSPKAYDEKLKFQRYNSRFSGMDELFGLHEECGHGSFDHGNHYTRPPWPRP